MTKSNLHSIFVLLKIMMISLLLTSCFGDATTSTPSQGRSSRDFLHKTNFKLNSVADLQQLFTYEENRYPLVSAHRGGAEKGYPENAKETFARVANQMPVIIECDVRLSKDSVLVLIHDETLDRTTTGTGQVCDYTVKELKNLQLKDNEGNVTSYRIPTLEEVLAWGNGKVVFTLDIKENIPYTLLSSAIEKTNSSSYVIVATYNAKQARALYNVNPDIMLSVPVHSESDLRRYIELGIPDYKLIAFVGTSFPESALVELLHNHGIKIILGGMGNIDKQAKSKGYQVYADYIDKGADVMVTNYPFEAKKALDFYIRKRKLTSPFVMN